VHVGFLFGPPRIISRSEASRLYDCICNGLRLDDFAFRYNAPAQAVAPGSIGFAIRLERKEGRGAFGITVDNPNIKNPVRLLLSYMWPPTVEHVKDQFDHAAAIVFNTLTGPWQKVHAEVRLQAQSGAAGAGALEYLRGEFANARREWVGALGQPLTFMSLRFEIASAKPEHPLDAPARQLTIEPLREDARSLYFELVSQWLQIPNVAVPPGEGIEAAQLTGGIDMASLRPIESPPSEYLQEAYTFLSERLQDLTRAKKAEQ
jgi:hypothetical protein